MIGTIQAVATRASRLQPPRRVEHARALDGTGLSGDVFADPLSPRQLLLADAAVYAELGLAAHALRENLLVDFETARLASGTVLALGADVTIRLTFQCEACGKLDAYGPGLSGELGTRRGVLARVVTGGVIRCGDPVRDLGVRAPAWSDDWRERVRRVLDAVPPGCTIEYKQLARLAGIESSYCRAFPRLTATLGGNYSAIAVAARSATTLPRWDGAGLFDDY